MYWVFQRQFVYDVIIIIIIIIIIHEFQSDASPEELQGRCSVTVFSLWLWPVTHTLPNDLTNSSVFRARLKLWTVGRDVIAVGNEFQTLAAAIGNARSPIVLCNERGTCSIDVEPERSRLHASMSETGWS